MLLNSTIGRRAGSLAAIGPDTRTRDLNLSDIISTRSTDSLNGCARKRYARPAMTKTDQTLESFRHLNVWKRGDVRAPHKPLLVLYALGRLQAGSDRLIPYDEIDQPLTRLLDEFGPPRRSAHPELPFYHLQTDGVWEIEDRVPLRIRMGSKNPLKSELKKFRIAGGFTEEVYAELKRRPELVPNSRARSSPRTSPSRCTKAYARPPESPSRAPTAADATRHSARRSSTPGATAASSADTRYSSRCRPRPRSRPHPLVPGRRARLSQQRARLLHRPSPRIRSRSHHDLGRRRIVISDRLYGHGKLDELFLALHGTAVAAPNRKDALPKPEFLAWHRAQVFRGQARD